MASSSTVVHQLLGPPEIYQTNSKKLLGPPEIHKTISPPTIQEVDHDDQPVVVSPASPPPPSSFMDLMVANFNNTVKKHQARTENYSPTYFTTGNPLLDFFFHVVPNTPPESLTERLELAWKHDPLKALKLVCHLRGVRGTGKSDKEGFYAAALWLHKNHPKTLACNVRSFAQFGYFKDLPEILHRILGGLKIQDARSSDRPNPRRTRPVYIKYNTGKDGFVKSLVPREERVSIEMKRVQHEKERASNLRKEKTIAKAKKAVERYNSDSDYRFLHDRISDLFAESLVSDLQSLNSRKLRNISFASKWCPSPDFSFDQSTLLCEGIARRIFPRDSDPEYVKIEEAHYVYRVRDRLRKEVLVPLRKALELPEVYMSSKRWDSLPYNRVPSVAMQKYNEIFMKHDEERFKEYLESVKRGEKKIAAGALLPHQIIESLGELHDSDNSDDDDDCNVAELQWRRMVEDLSKKAKLRDSLALCDVSGSMSGTPMEVCVALGLLISDISEDPWKGKVITFSSNPQLHTIEGDNLRSKTKFIRQMDWGSSTDFQKVFDLILQVAVNGNLKDDQMIKRLFVFSDMEFDMASENYWETDYQAIQRKFKERGFTTVPEIVFWNLRDSKATPVEGEQKGVALVSGFSQNLLRLFLKGKDIDVLNPVSVMEWAISGKEYNNLVVVD